MFLLDFYTIVYRTKYIQRSPTKFAIHMLIVEKLASISLKSGRVKSV